MYNMTARVESVSTRYLVFQESLRTLCVERWFQSTSAGYICTHLKM